MNNIYDFSYFDREVEIKTLEAVLKKLHDDAIKKSIESYGPEHGHMMAATKLDPIAHVYSARLEKLKREQHLAMQSMLKEERRIGKNFIKKMLSLSQKQGELA